MGCFVHTGDSYDSGWYNQGDLIGYADGEGRLRMQRKGGAALILLL